MTIDPFNPDDPQPGQWVVVMPFGRVPKKPEPEQIDAVNAGTVSVGRKYTRDLDGRWGYIGAAHDFYLRPATQEEIARAVLDRIRREHAVSKEHRAELTRIDWRTVSDEKINAIAALMGWG